MKRLQGKVALITGAGRGLGAAMARRFFEAGARVIVNDLNAANAEAVAGEVDGLSMVADVADSAAVAAMFEAVEQRAGRLDILVNNAGIMGMEGEPDKIARWQGKSVAQMEEAAAGGPIETHTDRTIEMTDEEWRQMLAVHLDGTFYCCREGLKIMSRQNSGSVINLGSIMGTAGGGGSPHYCAAKAGILGLTRALAREVVTRSIRVNAIAPGWIDTDMTSGFDQLHESIAMQTPMGRFGEPDDIAWAAIYLASDEAKFVTGQVLSPNGGWHMSQ